MAIEFGSKLSESQKSHGVIETGYSHTRLVSFTFENLFILIDGQRCTNTHGFFSEKKKTKYVKSELRLIETLDGICDRILQYNIHKVPQKNLLSIKILPVQIQCQFSFIILIPKKIRRGKIRQDLQKVKVRHSALWRVWWPKVWR